MGGGGREREEFSLLLPKIGKPWVKETQSPDGDGAQEDGEIVWREAWASGVGSAGEPGLRPRVPRAKCRGEFTAPGQNCVKVAGRSGKLGQPLANRPARRRKRVKGTLQASALIPSGLGSGVPDLPHPATTERAPLRSQCTPFNSSLSLSPGPRHLESPRLPPERRCVDEVRAPHRAGQVCAGGAGFLLDPRESGVGLFSAAFALEPLGKGHLKRPQLIKEPEEATGNPRCVSSPAALDSGTAQGCNIWAGSEWSRGGKDLACDFFLTSLNMLDSSAANPMDPNSDKLAAASP